MRLPCLSTRSFVYQSLFFFFDFSSCKTCRATHPVNEKGCPLSCFAIDLLYIFSFLFWFHLLCCGCDNVGECKSGTKTKKKSPYKFPILDARTPSFPQQGLETCCLAASLSTSFFLFCCVFLSGSDKLRTGPFTPIDRAVPSSSVSNQQTLLVFLGGAAAVLSIYLSSSAYLQL